MVRFSVELFYIYTMYLLLYEWRGDNKPEWRGYKVFIRRGGAITNQYHLISNG